MSHLPPSSHPDLLLAVEHGADAGVYRLTDELAIVLSADFFPPLISDAYLFGRVAAANSLSDLYAIGARPVTALNLLATPKDAPPDSIVAMLRGAQDVVHEAGAVIAGGHTILGKEVMFGLSVTGIVHPDKMLRNTTPRLGDALVLTKPLGSGILVHAFNAGEASEAELAHCIEVMATLSRAPSSLLGESEANAATDITGFGLLGHALDMLSLGGMGFELDYALIPRLENVEHLALSGNYPGGSWRNCEFTDCKVEYDGCPEEARLVLNDAQTSGGLLISLPPGKVEHMQRRLKEAKYPFGAVEIGKVVPEHPGKIKVVCR